MHHCQPADPLGNFFERQLNELKAVTAYPELATAAALDFCAKEGIGAPLWLVKRAAELMCDLLKREKAQRRGRTAGHIARYRQDFWDMERFDAIFGIRRFRSRVQSDLKISRSLGPAFKKSKRYEYIKRERAWLRHGTYQCASMYLSGRNSRAGADAIKASYRRVSRNTAGKAALDQYYLFDEAFLRKLGFPGLFDRKPGTKLLPLCNLTP